MQFSYQGINTHTPEGGIDSGPIRGRLEGLPGGRSAEFSLASEKPMVLEPRSLPLTDVVTYDQSPAANLIEHTLLNLIATGDINVGPLLYPRQNMEIRARSLQVINPINVNWLSIPGYGLVIDRGALHQENIFNATVPSTSLTLADVDRVLMGEVAGMIGNLSYLPTGRTEITAGNDPLGGYTLNMLREKIAHTQTAAGVLNGLAVTPKWLLSAAYEGLTDRQGKTLGVGVYELPPHLLQEQLAELAAWLEFKGQRNDLFQRFIFQANMALNALNEANLVHLQPHRGNVHASLSDGFLPVMKDYTTLTNITTYSTKVHYPNFNDMSPFRINMVQDVSILNRNLLSALIQVERFPTMTAGDHRLGLLPPDHREKPMDLDKLAINLAWAAAGRVAEPGTFPSHQSIGRIVEILKPKLHEVIKFLGGNSANIFAKLDELVQTFAASMVGGRFPEEPLDAGCVTFYEDIRSAYSPFTGKRKH